jgi:DNA uptake protein ComE-like DNA-binding protein
VDLNSASAEGLDRVGALGRERFDRIIKNRPFRSWDDLRGIEGFGGILVDDLRRAGATFGGQR